MPVLSLVIPFSVWGPQLTCSQPISRKADSENQNSSDFGKKRILPREPRKSVSGQRRVDKEIQR
jgi:hypothetical protein